MSLNANSQLYTRQWDTSIEQFSLIVLPPKICRQRRSHEIHLIKNHSDVGVRVARRMWKGKL